MNRVKLYDRSPAIEWDRTAPLSIRTPDGRERMLDSACVLAGRDELHRCPMGSVLLRHNTPLARMASSTEAKPTAHGVARHLHRQPRSRRGEA